MVAKPDKSPFFNLANPFPGHPQFVGHVLKGRDLVAMQTEAALHHLQLGAEL